MVRIAASSVLDPLQETVQRLALPRSARRTTNPSASPTTMAVSTLARPCRLKLVGTAMPLQREEKQQETVPVAMGARQLPSWQKTQRIERLGTTLSVSRTFCGTKR